MTTYFVWVRGPKGPAPSRCDDETMETLRKYNRILSEHALSDDIARLPLDALALQFPAPEVSDADHR